MMRFSFWSLGFIFFLHKNNKSPQSEIRISTSIPFGCKSCRAKIFSRQIPVLKIWCPVWFIWMRLWSGEYSIKKNHFMLQSETVKHLWISIKRMFLTFYACVDSIHKLHFHPYLYFIITKRSTRMILLIIFVTLQHSVVT